MNFRHRLAFWPTLVLSMVAFSSGSLMAPAQNSARSKSTGIAASNAPSATVRKQTSGPFHGKLAVLDKGARSIKVGKRTFYVTAQTKIMKNDSPARFEDGVVGETASGYFTTAEDGRFVLKSLRFGKKGSAASETSSRDRNKAEAPTDEQ